MSTNCSTDRRAPNGAPRDFPRPLHHHTSDPLLSRILGRSRSLFADDLGANETALGEAVRGARLLVMGAGGSIGRAFVKQVLAYHPGSVHAVDINENTLAGLVRDVRSSTLPTPDDFRTFCVDFGSEAFSRLWQVAGPYDHFINFAAMKHVRSERDVYSLMRMVRTNAGCLRDFMGSLNGGVPKTVFSVSTDKTVRPVNLMGATKNLMEKILFAFSDRVTVSTARFANVAFSDGSLLDGFVRRLAAGQPLAGPSDVRRYFISHEEAGQLCLLACFLGLNRDAFFPKMDEERHLITFPEIAALILDDRGLEPLPSASEDEARRMVGRVPGKWPCHFAPSNTTGEKPVEEFFGDDDDLDLERYRNIGVVRGAPGELAPIDRCLEAIEGIRCTENWSKEEVVRAVRIAVPELCHNEKNRSLDEKM